MAFLVLAVVLAQGTDPGGLTANQVFWLGVLDRLVPLAGALIPAIAAVLFAVAAWIQIQTRREVKDVHADVATARAELGEVRKDVDGKMTLLLQAKDDQAAALQQAAHAEGMVEVLKEQPAAPTPVILPVVLPPVGPTQGVPGGRRADDGSSKPPAPDPPSPP